MIELKSLNSPVTEESSLLAQQSIKRLMDRADLGFHRVCERPEIFEESSRRAKELLEAGFETFVVVGVGGSSLGPRVIREMSPSHPVEMLFLDTPDPLAFSSLIEGLKAPERTHWIWISKSGATLETLVARGAVDEYYRGLGLQLAENSTVILDQDQSPLGRWARDFQISILKIPQDVGGRFSVLTSVGILPAALLGWDLEDLKKGIRWALNNTYFSSEMVARALESFKQERWITVMWPYCENLQEFSLWWQQLWSESLAKAQDREAGEGPRVSSPMVMRGVQDQHSLLQQVMEGAKDKWLWQLRVTSLEEDSRYRIPESSYIGSWAMGGKTLGQVLAAEAQATQQALVNEGIPCLEIRLQDLSPGAFGALVMSMELMVGALGEALNIDAFNQPGVESGKRIVGKILAKPVV